MMPSCTEREHRDAMRAQAWLYRLSQDRETWLSEMETIDQLVERYGLLFNPRWMICQRCLGARYGQGPERRRRQHARKKGISRFPSVEVREVVHDEIEEEMSNGELKEPAPRRPKLREMVENNRPRKLKSRKATRRDK